MEKELDPNRPDLIFSHWILIWYVLYIIGIVPYNPKYLFILGIALTVFQLGMMVLYHKSFSYIFAFILANLLMKGLPLYTIYTRKTTDMDAIVMMSSVVLYAIWLKINNKNLYRFWIEFITPSANGRKAFPMVSSFQAILSKL
jgi:hypothetical protein